MKYSQPLIVATCVFIVTASPIPNKRFDNASSDIVNASAEPYVPSSAYGTSGSNPSTPPTPIQGDGPFTDPTLGRRSLLNDVDDPYAEDQIRARTVNFGSEKRLHTPKKRATLPASAETKPQGYRQQVYEHMQTSRGLRKDETVPDYIRAILINFLDESKDLGYLAYPAYQNSIDFIKSKYESLPQIDLSSASAPDDLKDLTGRLIIEYLKSKGVSEEPIPSSAQDLTKDALQKSQAEGGASGRKKRRLSSTKNELLASEVSAETKPQGYRQQVHEHIKASRGLRTGETVPDYIRAILINFLGDSKDLGHLAHEAYLDSLDFIKSKYKPSPSSDLKDLTERLITEYLKSKLKSRGVTVEPISSSAQGLDKDAPHKSEEEGSGSGRKRKRPRLTTNEHW